ncbi:MAG TPA: PEGA domain-containing protein [Bryobacteraceae bacterium]|nr:PEGA domain-containing protein [Bryobacteraceae bacterium]
MLSRCSKNKMLALHGRWMLLLVTLVSCCRAVDPVLPSPRVYVNNIGGFGSYLAAAFRVKGVPITVVMDRRQADFEIVGASESKNPNWAEVIFLKHARSNEAATISLINLRTTEVIYAYAYNMGQAYNGKQSAAESCAKHLRSAILKREVDFSRAGGALTATDNDRPAGETTTVPPSEPSAAGPLKPEELLMSIKVDSSPQDAFVQVDGYPAGRTPMDVKLSKGDYTLNVSKPGFQTWSQKITVEPGRTQSLGITLAATQQAAAQK